MSLILIPASVIVAKPKIPWTLQTSVFAARKHESDGKSFWDEPKLLARCFQADWTQTKCQRVVKDSDELHRVTEVRECEYAAEVWE
jgi:hypothetical protein